MDGNKFKDCRFRIDAIHVSCGEKKYDWFSLDRRRTETNTTMFGGQRDIAYWENKGRFETLEEARARYELIKDLPEYLP